MNQQKDGRKVIYYEDELNDEFSLAEITPLKIDDNYKYCHDSLFKKFTHFFWYRIIATPIAYFYMKLVFHHKVVGRELLKDFRDKGYFMYGNHTQDIADAVIPTLLNFPKDVYIIAHPNNVSIPCIGKVAASLGALPLPDDMKASQNFVKAIERRLTENNVIMVYPEAHIWPYYTKIRPFTDVSFRYPVKYKTPTFCFTNTYQERRKFLKSKMSPQGETTKKPKIVTYIDGPFYPDERLPAKEQKADLRNRIYECMCERAKNSTVVTIEYVKREEWEAQE